MTRKILVTAVSFLDKLVAAPPDEGKASKMLDELAAGSGGALTVEYRCNRSPLEPMSTEELKDVRAIIADLESYDRELLSIVGVKAGGPLELIARYGVGMNSVDIKAATEHGVMVTNCPGAPSLSTAEWALATIMSVAGKRILQHQRASAGKLKAGSSRLDVSGKTLGIIGTGSIGKTVAGLMAGYSMKLIAHDPFPDDAWAAQADARYVDLDTLCREADIITLHAATGDTIIGAKELQLMHPTTVLVNCARGIHVDTRAAHAAVSGGRIWGYGVDETWTEKDLSLEGLNIVTSPHVGSDTDLGKILMQLMSTQAVVDFVNGTTPEYVANREVLGE